MCWNNWNGNFSPNFDLIKHSLSPTFSPPTSDLSLRKVLLWLLRRGRAVPLEDREANVPQHNHQLIHALTRPHTHVHLCTKPSYPPSLPFSLSLSLSHSHAHIDPQYFVSQSHFFPFKGWIGLGFPVTPNKMVPANAVIAVPPSLSRDLSLSPLSLSSLPSSGEEREGRKASGWVNTYVLSDYKTCEGERVCACACEWEREREREKGREGG